MPWTRRRPGSNWRMARAKPTIGCCWPRAPVCVGYRWVWATIWRTSITCAPSLTSKRCAHPFAKGNASSSWAADISDWKQRQSPRSMGMTVTVIEAASRILARVACRETSAWFADLHRHHGVTLLEGQGFERFEGVGGVLKQVRLSDGTVLDADVALVGIGVLPNDRLAQEAGLACDNGIEVDGHCRTRDASIFAAGDCASFPYRGRRYSPRIGAECDSPGGSCGAEHGGHGCRVHRRALVLVGSVRG